MTQLTLALSVFTTLAVLDFIWGYYIKAVSDARALVAASWAIPLYALSGYVTIEFVKQPWLLIPACAGAFVGTYGSVWWATSGWRHRLKTWFASIDFDGYLTELGVRRHD